MNKTKFFRDLSSIINDSEAWITFYHKGNVCGTISLNTDKYGSPTKKELLNIFEFEEIFEGNDRKHKLFKIWFWHDNGSVYYEFDDYKVKSL